MNKKIRRFVERLGNQILRPFNLSVQHRWVTPGEIVSVEGMSAEIACERFAWLRRKLSFLPERIVDIGASDGRWTVPMTKVFPDAHFLLIEPLQHHAVALERLAIANPNLQYIQKIVSSAPCKMKINCHGHQSSVFGNSCGEAFGAIEEIDAQPLDSLLAISGFGSPDVIKLDIQGGELEALRGAQIALRKTQFVQVEFSLIPFQKGIPLLDEIVVFMAEAGFRVFDIYGVCARPLDGMPVQGECLFIKKDSELITNFRWSDNTVWS